MKVHVQMSRFTCAAVVMQDDLELINRSGQGRVDVSIGSALDLFGGKLAYEEVLFWHLQQRSSS